MSALYQPEFDMETAQVDGVQPKVLLQPDEVHEIEGSSNKKYKLKRVGDHYTCSCPSWSFQRTIVKQRTCKHLSTLLGQEYESARCHAPVVRAGGGGGAAPSTPKKERKAGPTTPSPSPRKRKQTENETSLNGSASPSKRASKRAGPGSSSSSLSSLPIKPMLAHTFELSNQQDESFYQSLWASEKLDGVRCVWDGKKLWSRRGNEFQAPNWWVARLPQHTMLDGELFYRRDSFDKTSGWVRSGLGSADEWKKVHYLVFDVLKMDDKPVEERWAVAKKVVTDGEMTVDDVIKSGSSKIATLPQIRIASAAHLEQMLHSIESQGGEGLMLRKAGSLYREDHRSRDLLKVKSWYDAEAVVVGYKGGEGRNKGRTGSLQVRMECGKIFEVGSGLNDQMRIHPPVMGTLIHYKFQELSHDGTPRFPIFLNIEHEKEAPKDAVVRSAGLRAAGGAG